MSVQENRASTGKCINVGCLYLRVPVQAANPVVLIIDGDKQYVRFFCSWCAVAKPDTGEYDRPKFSRDHLYPVLKEWFPEMTNLASQVRRSKRCRPGRAAQEAVEFCRAFARREQSSEESRA